MILISSPAVSLEIEMQPSLGRYLQAGQEAPFTGFIITRPQLETCVNCLKTIDYCEKNMENCQNTNINMTEFDSFYKKLLYLTGGFAFGFTLSSVLH
jgi:hypothetical protein